MQDCVLYCINYSGIIDTGADNMKLPVGWGK